MSVQEKAASTSSGAVIRPDDLLKITKEAEAAALKETFDADRKAEDEKKSLKDAFMSREIRTDAVERVNAAVRRAAEARKHELELFRFPASFCNDGGRRINSNAPDWPDSLEGFAKRAYEAYVEHYKPAGYRIKAQVMDFPRGMLGEIALILSW